VSEQRRAPNKELIEFLVHQVSRWKLTQPALLLLEVSKPLTFVVSQGLFLTEPLLRDFLGAARIAECATLLADRDSVECLIRRLDPGPTASRLPLPGQSAPQVNHPTRQEETC
jgi:hypothetical protein